MANRRLFRRALVALLAVGVALTAVGCGNQNSGPGYANADTGGLSYPQEALTKDELMTAAFDAAHEAGTAHFTLIVTRKTEKGTTCWCMRGTGDVVYGAAKPMMSMKMKLQGRQMVMRLVGGLIYLQVPGVTPPGRFIAVDPQDKKSEFARGFADGGGTMDPGATLENLQSAVKSAERVGKQVMHGVSVEHYQVAVDTASMLKQARSAANAGGMPDTVEYDMWLDEKHRIHRMSYEVAGMTFEQTMSRWGQPVHIQKPAARQVMRNPGI